MRGDGIVHFEIPAGMNYVAIVNNTGNRIELYQKHVTDTVFEDILVEAVSYQNITVPIRFGGMLQFTVIYYDDGVVGDKRVTILFADENLGINSQSGSLQGASSVGLISDSVGLAKSAQLPAALSGGGNLKVELQNSAVEIVNDAGNAIPVSGTVNVGTVSGTVNVVKPQGRGWRYTAISGITAEYLSGPVLVYGFSVKGASDVTIQDNTRPVYYLKSGSDQTVQFSTPVIFETNLTVVTTAACEVFFITDRDY